MPFKMFNLIIKLVSSKGARIHDRLFIMCYTKLYCVLLKEVLNPIYSQPYKDTYTNVCYNFWQF